MKSIFYTLLFSLLFFSSCSPDSEEAIPKNEVEGLVELQRLENDTHIVELYAEQDHLEQGYNEIILRIRDKGDQVYIENANLQWVPMMHMETKQHSAPSSAVTKIEGTKSLYGGFIVFQMPGNASEYWTLSLDYEIGGVEYNVSGELQVLPSERRRVAVFSGSNENRYVLALVAPTAPKVAPNDIRVVLHEMTDMMNFSVVDGYLLKIDPRMPAMGNHSSPNNVDLTQNQGDLFYQGKLNLTMTGLWRINLQVMDESGEVIKGEPVSEENETSSLYLELEF